MRVCVSVVFLIFSCTSFTLYIYILLLDLVLVCHKHGHIIQSAFADRACECVHVSVQCMCTLWSGNGKFKAFLKHVQYTSSMVVARFSMKFIFLTDTLPDMHVKCIDIQTISSYCMLCRLYLVSLLPNIVFYKRILHLHTQHIFYTYGLICFIFL